MPPNLLEPGKATGRLVGPRAQMVVLDLEEPIIQVEGPGDRSSLLPLCPYARLEPVLPIRRSLRERQHRAAVDGDEAAARSQGPSKRLVHRLELLAVSRVVEQVRGDHEVEVPGASQLPGIADDVLDPESILGLLLAGQL